MDNKIIPYSSLQNSNRKYLRDLIPLRMPLALFIDPSNRCNFKCVCCPRSFNDYYKYVKTEQHIEPVLFNKIINEIHKWGKLKVIRLFYLGEPFLNPNIIDMIRIICESEITERIEITSNGSVLNEKMSKELVEVAQNTNTIIYMRMSIYSVIQEINARITNSQISVDRIKDNIQRLREIRDSVLSKNPFIYVKMLDSLSDDNKLFIEMYKDIADEVVLEDSHNWSGYANRSLQERLFNEEQLKLIKINQKRKVCPVLFYTLAIQSDGDVVCCSVDWTRHTKVGNVYNQTLKDIWNGKILKQLQISHLEGKRCLNQACRNCDLLNLTPEKDNIDDLSVEQFLDKSN